jgi:hypothetical protein
MEAQHEAKTNSLHLGECTGAPAGGRRARTETQRGNTYSVRLLYTLCAKNVKKAECDETGSDSSFHILIRGAPHSLSNSAAVIKWTDQHPAPHFIYL